MAIQESKNPRTTGTTMKNPVRERGIVVPEPESVQLGGVSSLTIGQNDAGRAASITGDSDGCLGTTRIQRGKVTIVRVIATVT